jgi:hypothetical protein
MKTGAGFSSARDRDGGAFCSAHVTHRRPAGASAHGLPCMASRLRQRGAVLRETLPTPFFTSLRRTPHPPDQVTPLQCGGHTAREYPAMDGGYPIPAGKGGGTGNARSGGHGGNRVPGVHGESRDTMFHWPWTTYSVMEQLK